MLNDNFIHPNRQQNIFFVAITKGPLFGKSHFNFEQMVIVSSLNSTLQPPLTPSSSQSCQMLYQYYRLLGEGGEWAGGYFTNKSFIRYTGICFMIPRQSINFPESLPKAVVLKYCKLSYTEETLVDSFYSF